MALTIGSWHISDEAIRLAYTYKNCNEAPFSMGISPKAIACGSLLAECLPSGDRAKDIMVVLIKTVACEVNLNAYIETPEQAKTLHDVALAFSQAICRHNDDIFTPTTIDSYRRCIFAGDLIQIAQRAGDLKDRLQEAEIDRGLTRIENSLRETEQVLKQTVV